ncbi:anaerobic ribonucleoside-triphosphate reductase activating protein, partial [Anaerosporobacter sp.]|uniref:anaerobic ribonucleoside-triphosphate reductase activating protein n=1 Tax=Anaerosporobacter sp. TaxID=1872529 RepID=UPI00286F6729
QIHGFNKTTLLDYPKHLAATIFLGHCNFRCPFCHNSSLVLSPDMQPTLDTSEVLDTLKKRRAILEGVCITGGEPTLSKDLPSFIEAIKDIGLKVKLDTNGSNPLMLEQLLSCQLLDYVAMDIKNSRERYAETIGIENYPLETIDASIALIKNSSIPYEFRTTIVQEFHSLDDLLAIGKWLEGSKEYYLQLFLDSGDILSPGLHAPTRETMLEYQQALLSYFNTVGIRGMD